VYEITVDKFKLFFASVDIILTLLPRSSCFQILFATLDIEMCIATKNDLVKLIDRTESLYYDYSYDQQASLCCI